MMNAAVVSLLLGDGADVTAREFGAVRAASEAGHEGVPSIRIRGAVCPAGAALCVAVWRGALADVRFWWRKGLTLLRTVASP